MTTAPGKRLTQQKNRDQARSCRRDRRRDQWANENASVLALPSSACLLADVDATNVARPRTYCLFTEQQTIIMGSCIIYAFFVNDERVGERTNFHQPKPITARPSQTRT